MEPIIEVRKISKKYKLGARAQLHGSFREALQRLVLSPGKRAKNPPDGEGTVDQSKSIWALRDVNLDVYKGDTIGVIGANGAGKSTLLKIMSRITDPTEGYMRVRGNIGSLLEVGTGFHPELSGRENIFLNGAILGMLKSQIDAKFDEIVSFAGISRFLDTPVKRYSSGMYVRLAFSIAAHLDPEILIVDEVLAVGDVAFQKKCLGKMAEACSRAKTVIFVSHNLSAVESLCSRGIVLHRGTVAFDGGSKDAVQFYLRNIESATALTGVNGIDLSASPGRSPAHRPYLTRLDLLDQTGQPLCGDFPTGSALRAVVHFSLDASCTSFDASIAFDTPTGQRVCTAHSAYEPDRVHQERSGEQAFICDIPSVALVPGDYRISVGLDIAGHEVDWVDGAARLSVIESDYYGTGVVPTKGMFLLPNRWTLCDQPVEVCQ
jgi:homopolymeric O-antigen transport system ATP-binding protein